MQVAIPLFRYIEVKRSAVQRVAKAQSEKLCVACLEPLNGETPVRGCHQKCYRATFRGISAGKTTLEERIAEGKLLPPATTRAPRNPVTKELSGVTK